MVNIKEIKLQNLGDGLPYLTPSYGLSLAEAGAVCLENQGHHNGVELMVNGDFDGKFRLYWSVVDEQTIRCHADLGEATERGAYGIAILLIMNLAGFKVVERSVKGTGFDYWLGFAETLPFQNKSRLEVSGILNGVEKDIRRRLREKVEQTKKSDRFSIPAYVVIVEYSNPLSRVIKR